MTNIPIPNTSPIRSDVVPIMFIGGTGGNFLGSLLYHARKNIKFDNKNFSDTGNAHACLKDKISFSAGSGCRPILHLKYFLEIPITDEVKYVHTHCRDPLLFLNYFDKIIKTCYTPDDINEIAVTFAIKWTADHGTGIQDHIPTNVEICKYNLTRYPSLSNPCDNNRVFNISWKELLYADTSIVISNLSDFTQIPYNNFDLNSFLEWRELTLLNLKNNKEYL